LKSFPDFETERLTLRAPTLEDIDNFQSLWSLEEVSFWTKSIPHPLPDNFATDFLDQRIARRNKGDLATYAIEVTTTQKFIGYIDLIFLEDNRAELSFALHPDYQNQGFITEAATNLLALAFEHFGISHLCAIAKKTNLASHKVLQRLGFEFEKEFIASDSVRAVDENLYFFQLPQETFHSMRLQNGCAGINGPSLKIPTLFVSAVILIDADDRILLAQRPAGKSMAGLWEFPGGKVEQDETPEAALVRELQEELGINTKNSCLAPFTFASHSYPEFHLLMPLYICRIWEGTPTPKEGQRLAWVRSHKLRDYPMPPADEPLIAMIRDFL
jgi:8-oxo-dGTP diphosphatase